MMISLDQWNMITNLILSKLLGNFDAMQSSYIALVRTCDFVFD